MEKYKRKSSETEEIISLIGCIENYCHAKCPLQPLTSFVEFTWCILCVAQKEILWSLSGRNMRCNCGMLMQHVDVMNFISVLFCFDIHFYFATGITKWRTSGQKIGWIILKCTLLKENILLCFHSVNSGWKRHHQVYFTTVPSGCSHRNSIVNMACFAEIGRRNDLCL